MTQDNTFMQEFVNVNKLIEKLKEPVVYMEGCGNIPLEYISKEFLMDIINELIEVHTISVDTENTSDYLN